MTTGKIIELRNEPWMICRCGCSTWYLICQPDTGDEPRHIIAFECSDCGARIPCEVFLIGLQGET